MYYIVNRRYVGDHVPRNFFYTNLQFYTIAYYGIQMEYKVWLSVGDEEGWGFACE